MDDSAKYLIHAEFVADGVIERSDVVGAVFGQTEGLLGDDLDLRDLQQASKVGRIDVEVDSEGGRSHGEITIATTLDKVETAILAASLETIDRVGPCRSEVSVSEIEDVRAAKRREVVERAKELLIDAFDENVMDSREILEEVRSSIRVEDITEYHGLPAGPHVESSDAIIVVEGRADVLTLLGYGIKNAVAVEGTNVPDAIAELTHERTVTTFLDGDRGGELILRELQQVGDVDYVAFAPEGRSVEDLPRHDVMSALRQKRPIQEFEEENLRPDDGGSEDAARPPNAPSGTTESSPAQGREAATETIDLDETVAAGADADRASNGDAEAEPTVEVPTDDVDDEASADVDTEGKSGTGADSGSDSEADSDRDSEAPTTQATLREHVRDVHEGDGGARLLDADLQIQTETDLEGAFDALEAAEAVPYALVIDGELSQRLLDVAAQRGVEHIVAGATGEYVKKPIGVRIRTIDELLDRAEAA